MCEIQFLIQITDGDGDGESWVRAFAGQGELLDVQADDWLARGARRNAGEARLKAFAAKRSSWQFASPDAAESATKTPVVRWNGRNARGI